MTGYVANRRSATLISAGFIRPAFDHSRRREAVRNAGGILTQLGPLDKTSLVGTGMSGAMMLGIIADNCSCSCTLVRKKQDATHSDQHIEGEMDFDNYIIVDDVIDSGETVERIRREIEAVNPDATLEGILLYNDNSLDGFAEQENRFGCWVRAI